MKKYYVLARTQSYEKRGKWVSNGETSMGRIDCDKIFDTIEKATKFYESIELSDTIDGNYRYSDYKELYEIDGSIDDIDDINLDEASLIKEEYTF